jgi:parallel beta-helix repeat protein
MKVRLIAALVLILGLALVTSSGAGAAQGPFPPLPASANVTDADRAQGAQMAPLAATSLGGIAASATLEVSQPTRLTSDSHYERGQSIVYDGSNYWLFYGRSATVTLPYSGGSPDVNDYQICFQKAGTVAGLAAATPSAISGAANIYLGETGAAFFGGEPWAFGPVASTTTELYGWYSPDGGTSWTQVGPVVTPLPSGAAHHDETVFGGELWVLVSNGGGYTGYTTMHSATPKSGGWSTPLSVGALSGGLGHFFVDGSDLYVALGSGGTYYIYKYNSSGPQWDLVDSKTISNYYDPTLLKVGSSYVFAAAPWDGTRQYITAWHGSALDESFFDPDPIAVTEGQYGANPWVDMWPIGLSQGGTSYLLFTSERNPADTASEIAGDIWVLTYDWPVDRSHYTYIQEAIDAAVAGGIVEVAAGTYVENIWVNKSLELAGAGAGSVTIYPAVSLPNPCAGSSLCGSRTAASNIILTEANDISIHGFTLDGDNPSLTSGLVIEGADLDARNGIIEYGPAGVFNNLEVYETTVKNIYLRGIYANSYGTGFHFHDNTVQNVQGEANSIAIFNFGCSGTIERNAVSYANDAIAANWSTGTQFLDNTVTDSSSGVHTDNNGGWGGVADVIRGNNVNNGGSNAYGVWAFFPYLNTTIDNNTVTNVDVALFAWGGAGGRAQFTNNIANGQNRASSACAYVTTGLTGWPYLANVSASFIGNDLYNCADAFVAEAETAYQATIVASSNSLHDNTKGMSVQGAGTISVDASGNWWGSNVPGTVKAAASGGSIVDYTPWLASGADKDVVAAGFQGDFSTLWVDNDSPQTGTTGRIQEGVDLVSGSTVNVAAGTYVEQVIIQKDLDLIGAGESTTIVQPPSTRTGMVAQGSNTWDYVLAAYASSGTIDVRVEGFTFDANGQAKQSGTTGLVGVYMSDVTDAGDTTAGLHACTIEGFEAVEYQSWGIRVHGDSVLTLNDNALSDYTRDGIVVNGDGGAGADPQVAITGNDLTGNTLCLNGIQVGYGATATVTANTVRDHTRSSAWAAVGILAYQSDGVTVGVVGSGNTVRNCHYGIHLLESDNSTVVGNVLDQNIAFHIGLDDSNNNQVRANTIIGTVGGSEDNAIGLSHGSTDNTVGGMTAAEGNTITMATSGTGLRYGVYLQSTVGSGSNTIQNNTFTGGTRFVQVDGGNSGTTTVADNTVSGTSFAGVYFNAGSAVIAGNTLNNTVRPIEFWGLANVSISGNTINGAAFDGINAGSKSGALSISGNDFHNLPAGCYAIHVRPDCDDALIDDNEIYSSDRGIIIDAGATGAQITNNNIHDNGFMAIELHESVSSLTGNFVDSNWRGVETWVALTASRNSFTNHAYGSVILHHGGPHDVGLNWWGSASPAAVGGAIVKNSNPVDYTPWLGLDTDTEPSTAGFQPDLSVLWVDDDSQQTGSTGRIQEGVNLVSGSTVNVAAGTYVEQVVINKDVDLTGHDSPVVQAPSTVAYFTFPEGGSYQWEPVVFAFGGTLAGSAVSGTGEVTVTVSDLIVDGNSRIPSPTSRRAVGILYRNVLGGVDGCTVRNMGYSTASVNSWGIMAYGTSDVILQDNDVSGYAKGGFVVNGARENPALPKPNAVIEHNTVTGPPYDPAMTLAPNGIQIGWGATGSVTNNTVTNNGYAGTDWGGSGILIQSSPNVLVEGNVCTENDYGIAVAGYSSPSSYATGAIVRNNTVEGNGLGILVEYRSVDTLVEGNTITGNGDGIQVGSTDHLDVPPVSTDIHNNVIAGNTTSGLYVVANPLQEEVDAEYNWWGSACGPAGDGCGSGDAILGNADYSPWWSNLAMTTEASEGPGGELVIPAGATTAEQQAILDCAAPGTTVTWEVDTATYAGGIQVNTNDLTLDLNGNTVGSGSPWLTVNADDVTVVGPGTIDGGGGGGAGILVQGGADNFILDSTEVTGWATGIELAGDVESFKIVSNWIHSNTEHGLLVDADVDLTGVVTIEGNLFKVNGGNGIQHNGTVYQDGLPFPLPAEYNSWGDPAGPSGPLGDGVGSLHPDAVDFDPWTYVESFFDVWPDTLALERHVPEDSSFDVALKADAVNLYGITFQFTYDTARLTLNSTTFSAPWAGRCAPLPGLPAGTIGYYCSLQAGTAGPPPVPADPEWTATAGTIATFNFTANTLPSDFPLTAYLDLSHLETDTSASAIGGQKVFVNNAGFNDPSATARDITDTDDGRIVIESLANYTGFVDLQGRTNDSGALVEVYSQAAKGGAVKLAEGTSASSGAYTTAHVSPNWLVATSTYWFQVDRALYLPTTAIAADDYDDSKQLDVVPLKALAKVVLLGGDATNNNEIDVGDLSCIGGDYGKTSGFTACGGTGLSDVNGDGIVNIQDLSMCGGNLYKNSSPWTP